MIKMKHPSVTAIKKVAARFKRILEHAKRVEEANIYYDNVSLVMGHTHVCGKHECNTPMCHAGWYAFSANQGERTMKYRSYRSGADLMAQELGFKNRHELTDWAYSNPKIWGNRNGFDMFNNGDAFNIVGKVYRDVNVNDVYLHWLGVAKRMEAHKIKLKSKK